jgi:hypothetical protein
MLYTIHNADVASSLGSIEGRERKGKEDDRDMGTQSGNEKKNRGYGTRVLSKTERGDARRV